MSKLSLVHYLPDEDPVPCGYCKKEASITQGFWAHFLSVKAYQMLLDRGWRRSGRYVYKPKMAETCCPMYTIRCNSNKFQPTKSQKKVAKKVRNFILHGKKSNDEPEEDIKTETSNATDNKQADKKCELSGEDNVANKPAPSWSENSIHKVAMENKRKKAKVLRLERRYEKAQQQDSNKSSNFVQEKNQAKSLYDLIPTINSTTETINKILSQDIGGNPKHKFELRLVRASKNDPDFRKHFDESYAVYKKYQMTVHNDPEEECSSDTFLNFLCNSPLHYEEKTTDEGKEILMGAFHQHYLIDGKIVAVGVIDILPSCLSSVYLFYDPDYGHLSLGTYSALREIQLCAGLELDHYYMGYYIHSCDKMRYKGKFRPSDLLSMDDYRWYPLEECVPLLDKEKFTYFSQLRDGDSSSKNIEAGVVPENIKIFFNHSIHNYGDFISRNEISAAAQENFYKFMEIVGNPIRELVYFLERDACDDDSDDSY